MICHKINQSNLDKEDTSWNIEMNNFNCKLGFYVKIYLCIFTFMLVLRYLLHLEGEQVFSISPKNQSGWLSHQEDALEWICILSDCSTHNEWLGRVFTSQVFSGKTSHHPCLSAPIQFPLTSNFWKVKITVILLCWH